MAGDGPWSWFRPLPALGCRLASCIRGMRLTVRRVVETVALYPDRTELKQEYPELEDDDIRQALEFAADNLDDQNIASGSA